MKKYIYAWPLMLCMADAPAGGSDAAASAKETLEQENSRLKLENQKLKDAVTASAAADAQRKADELIITEKTKLGLTRDQAIAVIKRQREHDEALKEKRGERLPAIKDIIKANRDEVAARRAARIQFPDMDGGEWADAVKAVSGRK
jgi:regulator of replication initiation timing